MVAASNFFKGMGSKGFFDGFVPLKPKTYCIVIIYDNNIKREVSGIDHPFKYMNALKKNPRIKTCYIKDEKTL